MEALTPECGITFQPEEVLCALGERRVCRITFDSVRRIIIGDQNADMPFAVHTGDRNVVVNMTVNKRPTEQGSALRISVVRFDHPQVQCADITREQLHGLLLASVITGVDVPRNYNASQMESALIVDQLLGSLERNESQKGHLRCPPHELTLP